MNTPDGWVFVIIDNFLVKVFASWSGDYLNGASWRLNSGVESIEETDEYYDVHGYSGSVYRLLKSGEDHINIYNLGVLRNIQDQIDDGNHSMREISATELKELHPELWKPGVYQHFDPS